MMIKCMILDDQMHDAWWSNALCLLIRCMTIMHDYNNVCFYQVSSSIIKCHQASSSVIKRHQASSSVIKHHQASSVRCVIVTKHSITCIFLFLGGKESSICSPYISKMCQFLRKWVTILVMWNPLLLIFEIICD